MRPALLLLVASLLSAQAAEIPAGGRVTAVTVYADRAEVVREASVRLEAGEQTLVFDNLPGATDLGSLRAEGTGAFTLLDIRPDTVQTVDVANPKVKELQERLAGLDTATEENRRAEGRVEARRTALGKVLDRVTTAGKDSPSPDLDPAKWGALVDYHAAKLADLDKESMALKAKAKDLQKETDLIRRELQALQAGARKVRQVARVTVEAKSAGEATLRLSYVVQGPSWGPSYDIRADVAAKTVDVAYLATVRQSTGEDWKGVALRLSTAQPSVHGREPELDPWFLAKQEPMPPAPAGVAEARPGFLASTSRSAKVQLFNAMPAEAGEGEPRVAADSASVRVVAGGVAAVFVVERKVDILADNKPVRAPLDRRAYAAAFRHTCVPKLSPHVYLKAKAVNASDLPYLPGPAAIYVDGAYVAGSEMELVPAGQEFWTYLGADASVKVERRLLADRTEVSGLIGKKTVSTVRDHLFKVSNGKAAPIELVIWDQLPVSNHEDIKVALDAPELRADDPNLKVDESKRLEWRLDLKAGEKRDLPFRFTVSRPEDVVVVGL